MKNKPIKPIVCVFVLLIISVVTLSLLNRNEDKLDPQRLQILIGNQIIAELTLADIQALPSIEVDKEIISGNGADQSGRFTCVALNVLLDQFAPDWSDGASAVICRAADNYTSTFSVGEVTTEYNILLAYLLDGQELEGQADDGYGPFRLVIPDDAFGNRSTYWLCRVEVE